MIGASPSSFRWLPLLVGAVALLLAVGCNDGRPRRYPVSGKVLIDGAPLEKGYVQVMPENARAAQARIESDGTFTLETFDDGDGAVLGTHRVAVIGNHVLSASQIKWLAPPKYRDPNTSGLTVTIDGPRDDVVLELTWDGGEPFIETTAAEGDSDFRDE